MLEAFEILETALGAEHERTVKVIQSLADLYTAWHEAEPDPDVCRDCDAQAAQWRAKLPAPPTQPASQPTTKQTEPSDSDGVQLRQLPCFR